MKSEIVIPLAFFFFLHRIALAIWDLFWFHMNFRIFIIIYEECHGNFDWDRIESKSAFEFYKIAFGRMVILTMLILPIHEQGVPSTF